MTPASTPGAAPTKSATDRVPFAEGFQFQPPPAAAGGASAAQVVYLAFNVTRVDIPVSSVRHSRKLWNHVDELRIPAELSANLVRNGLRVGVTSQASLEAIGAILETGKAKADKSQLAAQPNVPVTILLGELAEPESIFSFSASNSLVGKTVSAGHKVITLDYAYHPEFGGTTEVKVGFEIRHDRGTLSLERSEDTLVHVPAVDRHVFSNLAVELELRPGEILVVGPSEKAESPYIIGARFFSWQEAGSTPHETVLFIAVTPQKIEALQRR